MARLFISYATANRSFVLRLADGLRALGHHVSLDVQDICAGQGIPQRVAQQVESADFLLAILSKQSVLSSWVEHEWYAKYWEEVTTRQTAVIPVLLEDCTVPFFLRPKRYADFRSNYHQGLAELERALELVVFETPPVCYAEDMKEGQLL